MRAIIAFVLILLLSFLLQTAVLNRVMLVDGSMDLILVIVAAWALQENARHSWVWAVVAGLLIGGVSATPWYIFVFSYLAVVALARMLTRRIWQAPLLAMFLITFLGTFLVLSGTYVYRILYGVSLSFATAFSQVILPSLLLNLLVSIVIHPLIRDLASWVHPTELKA